MARNNDMTFTDWITALKAYEEWKAANKPKEEKKDDKNKFGPWEYFALYTAIHGLVVVSVTVLVLSHTH